MGRRRVLSRGAPARPTGRVHADGPAVDGHHLGDVNRFQLTLFPPAGTPYPVDAANPKGGFYGTGTRFPLPDKERFNNPNIPSTVNPGC